MGVAVVAAIDPDYPLARTDPLHSSVVPSPRLLPHPLQPVGWVATRRPRFCWAWDGPPVDLELVLLDEALDEVHRQRVQGRELLPDGALAECLAQGEQFHWFLEGTLDGRRVACAPAAFGFRR